MEAGSVSGWHRGGALQVPAQFHMKFRFGSGGEPEEDWGNDAP